MLAILAIVGLIAGVQHSLAGGGSFQTFPLLLQWPRTARRQCHIGGGALGAALLLAMPSEFFNALVPWLVLFATAVFAWGSLVRTARVSTHHLSASVFHRVNEKMLRIGITALGLALTIGLFMRAKAA